MVTSSLATLFSVSRFRKDRKKGGRVERPVATVEFRSANSRATDLDRLFHHGIPLMRVKLLHRFRSLIFRAKDLIPVSYTHLTLPTNREV